MSEGDTGDTRERAGWQPRGQTMRCPGKVVEGGRDGKERNLGMEGMSDGDDKEEGERMRGAKG